jgi:hypothetical protein
MKDRVIDVGPGFHHRADPAIESDVGELTMGASRRDYS